METAEHVNENTWAVSTVYTRHLTACPALDSSGRREDDLDNRINAGPVYCLCVRMNLSFWLSVLGEFACLRGTLSLSVATLVTSTKIEVFLMLSPRFAGVQYDLSEQLFERCNASSDSS